MIFLLIFVGGAIALAGLQIWKELARENKKLASKIQILAIVVTLLLAVAKTIGDYARSNPSKDLEVSKGNRHDDQRAENIGASTPFMHPSAAGAPAASPVTSPQSVAPDDSQNASQHATNAPTPCSSPMSITAEEIIARVWDNTLESMNKDSYISAIKGSCVEWTLRFQSAERMSAAPEEMFVSLTPNRSFTSPSVAGPVLVFQGSLQRQRALAAA